MLVMNVNGKKDEVKRIINGVQSDNATEYALNVLNALKEFHVTDVQLAKGKSLFTNKLNMEFNIDSMHVIIVIKEIRLFGSIIVSSTIIDSDEESNTKPQIQYAAKDLYSDWYMYPLYGGYTDKRKVGK